MNGWPPVDEDPGKLRGSRAEPDEIALSIVIPVYRSAISIGALVAKLAKLDVQGRFEIVLVDDGSDDGSARACHAAGGDVGVPVSVIEHSRNFGEHAAVLTGLRYARGAHIVTMDDDFQNPPDEVLRLLDHARSSGWDVVYGYNPVKRHALWRNLSSGFAQATAAFLLDKPSGVHLSTFRCMNAFTAREVTRYRGPFTHVDGLVLQVTNRVSSLPVRHDPRLHDRSNYTLRRLVRLWLVLATNFNLVPLRLAVVAAAVTACVGGLSSLLLLLVPEVTPSVGLLLVAVMCVSTVQMLLLGIVGEYVGRAFSVVSGRPQAIVRAASTNQDETGRSDRSDMQF